MLIEVLTPLTVRLNQREQRLTPGQPVELPDEKALKLLQKAPGQVRIVSPYLGQVVEVESLAGQKVRTLDSWDRARRPTYATGSLAGLSRAALTLGTRQRDQGLAAPVSHLQRVTLVVENRLSCVLRSLPPPNPKLAAGV